jgi:hypothetical protein
MFRLIVNAPDGFQRIESIEASGSYFNESLVIWDERINGAIPGMILDQVGGLSRALDGSMVFDQQKFNAQRVALQSKGQQEDQKRADRANAHARVKALDLTKTLSAAEQVQALKDVIALLVK